ncbi:MAG TPA: type VI immunity family protein [Myxococcales bacterium]|nr:type VI immunity family protein [Myxococcales bacterium]
MPPPNPPIDAIVLASAPRVTVARAELGLTLYLTDLRAWAAGGAARALEVFLRHAPRDWLIAYTTSQLPDWRPASEETHQRLLEHLSTPFLSQGPRHLLSFALVDDMGTPSAGFVYREVDPARAARSGVLELTLPQETSPGVLLQLAREVAECGPFFSGVGGYVTRWNPAHRHLAFDRIHEWCQRYWGLDVQDSDAMSWLAPHGLPGSNWLTLVGWPLLDLLGKSAPELKEGEQDAVTVSALSHGFLVRAGEEATVGDLNRTEVPVAYLAAARRLASGFVAEPPPFGGAFARNQDAGRWFRRMVDSLEWAA